MAKAVAKRYKHYHESVANGMIALLVPHVGAALWHRYVRRDAVMQRMLPAADVAFGYCSGAPCRKKRPQRVLRPLL